MHPIDILLYPPPPHHTHPSYPWQGPWGVVKRSEVTQAASELAATDPLARLLHLQLGTFAETRTISPEGVRQRPPSHTKHREAQRSTNVSCVFAHWRPELTNISHVSLLLFCWMSKMGESTATFFFALWKPKSMNGSGVMVASSLDIEVGEWGVSSCAVIE